jgi:hypothetical protein
MTTPIHFGQTPPVASRAENSARAALSTAQVPSKREKP